MAKKPKTEAANDIGHNSKELTEAERKALFFHHLRKRMAHNAKVKAATDARKEDGKLAQADGQVLGDIDFAIKTIGADDKKTVTDRFVAEGEILTWLGLSTGFQSDLFRDRAPAIEKISKAGELAGFAAKERVSGYADGSDEDTAWLANYDAAQAKMLADLESAMLKRNELKNEPPAEIIKGSESAEDPFSEAAE